MLFNIFDQVELKRIIIFKEVHYASCVAHGVSPGLFSYHFTPTTIATFICISCTDCGTEENITNLDVI